jgi:bacteriorhodopsin
VGTDGTLHEVTYGFAGHFAFTYFTVLWMGYPTAWLIGPSGLGLVNQTIDTLLFCVLPFFSKVGFSFLDLHGLRNLNSSRSRTAVGSGNL